MFKTISLFAALFAGFVVFGSMPVSAQSSDLTSDLKSLEMPKLEASAADAWKAAVLGCYNQANNHRKLGLDVRPVFRDLSGKDLPGLPQIDMAFKCHVDGSKELAAKR